LQTFYIGSYLLYLKYQSDSISKTHRAEPMNKKAEQHSQWAFSISYYSMRTYNSDGIATTINSSISNTADMQLVRK
jgi:hypothetical protein